MHLAHQILHFPPCITFSLLRRKTFFLQPVITIPLVILPPLLVSASLLSSVYSETSFSTANHCTLNIHPSFLSPFNKLLLYRSLQERLPTLFRQQTTSISYFSTLSPGILSIVSSKKFSRGCKKEEKANYSLLYNERSV